jgi:hypothetical protein
MPEKMIKGLGWLFIGIGALLLAGAFFAVMSSRSLLREGIRTTGNVIDFVESQAEDGQPMYAPVFSFLDEQGVEHQIRSNVSSSSYAYMKGQAVDVIYRPGDPQRAEIQSTFGLWGLAAILGFVGIFFLVFGIGTNFITRKILSSTDDMNVEIQFGSGDINDDSFD